MILSFLLRRALKQPGTVSKVGPIFIVSDPNHVEEVLVTKAEDFGKGGGMWDAIRPLLGEGLITAEGETWREQRRNIQPFFTKTAIGKLLGEMKEVVEEQIESMAHRMQSSGSNLVNMADEMRQIAQKLLLRLLFGSNHPPDLGEHLQTALAVMNRRLFLYFLPSQLIPGNKRFQRAISAIDERVMKLSTSFLSSYHKTGEPVDTTFPNQQQSMSDQAQRDQLVTFYVAGSETVASAMTWMFCAFAKNPKLQEMDIDLVARETLRLYPPIWFFPRFASTDTEIGGNLINKGKVVILCPLATQRDPHFWENPLEFNPNRLYPNHKFASYPFGAGARKCIGEYLALVEMKTVAQEMLKRFQFKLVEHSDFALSSATTLWPKKPLIRLFQKA